MKVVVVGSGSMWRASNSASYKIDEDIVVDMPNGMCKNLLKLKEDLGKVRNVLLTHFHGDHYFDIPFFFLFKARSEDKIVNVFCSKEGKRKNAQLLKLAFPMAFKEVLKDINLKYVFDNKFMVNDYQVEKLLVDHGSMKPAYGYIFSKDKIKVGFTGDSTLCESVEYMAQVCNYLFCDCMFIKGTSKHMGIDMLNILSEKYPNCHFVVSHLEDNTREELIKNKKDNIIVPEDGLVINIE